MSPLVLPFIKSRFLASFLVLKLLDTFNDERPPFSSNHNFLHSNCTCLNYLLFCRQKINGWLNRWSWCDSLNVISHFVNSSQNDKGIDLIIHFEPCQYFYISKIYRTINCRNIWQLIKLLRHFEMYIQLWTDI